MNRGDIYWVNLDPTQGSEIKKKRPCILIGATPLNKARNTVLVIPLSTSAMPRPPIVVSVVCNQKSVVAVCDQLRVVDKARLGNKWDTLSLEDLQRVEDGLRQVLVL